LSRSRITNTVTLCIATPACDESSSAGIVLCIDYLISDDLPKLSYKGDFSFASKLVATVDNLEDSATLIRFCKARIQGSLTLDSIKEQLWQGMQDFKQALLRLGRDHSDAQLLISGFVENEPRIIYLNEQGLLISQSFLAIGSGEGVAQAMLTWRKVTRDTLFDEAIHYVYEAKRIAEAVPSVGKNTTILVLQSRRDKELVVRELSGDSIDELQNQFDTIGPQIYRPGSPFLWKPLL
jgi:hypothetical protein